MRKVMIKVWIPLEYDKTESGALKQRPGTSCMSSDFTTEGYFHQWGKEIKEYGGEYNEQTIGIVELKDGTVEMVWPGYIKFVQDAINFL